MGIKKVEITKEQAGLIEQLKATATSTKYYKLIEEFLRPELRNSWNSTFSPLYSLTPHQFITCIYVGYTVKQTPEESIELKYLNAVDDLKDESSREERIKLQATIETLEWVMDTLKFNPHFHFREK